MKLDIQKDLLQKDIPTNKWLVKDTNKDIIRAISDDVENPEKLTEQEELKMHQLIDFVRYSQDPLLNIKEDDHLRPAVGLAGPQIGINKNMFFARFEWPDNDPEEIAAINPKILSRSVQIIYIEDGEGCLSVDVDRTGIVPRNYKIVVEYYDYLKKKMVHETLRGYKAIVFQHELEHNEGHLYYDKINEKDPKHAENDWLVL